mmetsp:Transcript_4985/g.11311  ORF Transcript_4985/g.11311 Transcript_4985/m.11311 type:complete len:288 (-) Transcript_4985:40-903(-)
MGPSRDGPSRPVPGSLKLDLSRCQQTFLFVDVRQCKTVNNDGKWCFHTAVVTDKHARAAHEYWHRKTNGLWAESHLVWPVEQEADRDIFNRIDTNRDGVISRAEFDRYLQGGLAAEDREEAEAAAKRKDAARRMSDHIGGTSGKLVSLERPAPVPGGPGRGAPPGVCLPGLVLVTIEFSNRMMDISVDFSVEELSRTDYEVRVLEERRAPFQAYREMCSVRSSLSSARRHELSFSARPEDHALWKISHKEIVGTRDAVGRVRTLDLLDGMSGTCMKREALRSFRGKA